ncbi:MAG: hypothetical protein AAGF04_05740 [Chlamydiota bacterium]
MMQQFFPCSPCNIPSLCKASEKKALPIRQMRIIRDPFRILKQIEEDHRRGVVTCLCLLGYAL